MTNTNMSTCCTCGYQWPTGTSGSHSCSVKMEETIARLRVENDQLHRLVYVTDKFFTDVLAQVGNLCIQDYANLNELAMLLTELKGDKSDETG